MSIKHDHFVIVFVLMLCCLMFKKAGAVPAYPGPIELTQPNGEIITAYLKGSEFSHHLTDEDGTVIEKNAKGYYAPNTETAEDVQLFSARSFTAEPSLYMPLSSLPQKTFQIKVPETIDNRQASSSALQKSIAYSPTNTQSIPLLVILVEYDDMKLSSRYNTAYWQDMFFNKNVNSVNAYYNEVSNGLLQFTKAKEAQNIINDGIVKVSLAKTHPQPEQKEYPYDILSKWQIVKDAIAQADAYVDFAFYDTDNNGYVSSEELIIAVIVAGYETAYANVDYSVWAHQSLIPESYTDYKVSADGKQIVSLSDSDTTGDTIGAYIMLGERWGTPSYYNSMQIGVACHELAHCLGIPDLYDTTGILSIEDGVGIESLMSYGSWAKAPDKPVGSSPTHIDPFFKYQLGWIELYEANNIGSIYTVTSMGSSSGYKAYIVPTNDSSEYFIVENRQFEGYDQGLQYLIKKGGIAIWHIDMDMYYQYIHSNEINGYGHTPAIMIERCGKDPTKVNNSYYYPFWSLKDYGYSSFSKFSAPNSLLNSGYDSNVRINTLSASSSNMSFSLSTPIYEMINLLTDTYISSSFINNSSVDIGVMPIVSIYDNTGKLLQVFTQTQSMLAPHTSMSAQSTFAYNITNNNITKITYWNNLTQMKPLISAARIANFEY